MKAIKNNFEFIAGGFILAIFLVQQIGIAVVWGIALAISGMILSGYGIFTLFTKRMLTPYPKQPNHPANHWGL